MILNWEKFQVAYSQASADIKLLIDSDKIPACAEEICHNYALPLSTKKALVISATNKILNLEDDTFNIKMLTEQGIDPIKIGEIILSLQNCISGKPTLHEETLPEDTTLGNLRTMKGDGKQIGYGEQNESLTYSTLQSTILREGDKKL